MPWNSSLTQLRDVLADLYPDMADARRVVAQAGLRTGHISLQGAAINVWHAILDEAEKQGQVAAVVSVALREYPQHQGLRSAALGVGVRAPASDPTTPSSSEGQNDAASQDPRRPAIRDSVWFKTRFRKVDDKEEPDRKKLLDVLTQRLSASELRALCFKLKIDYESLPGEAKPDRARELILYLERRERLPELAPALHALRPDIDPSSTFAGPPGGGSAGPGREDRPNERATSEESSAVAPPPGGPAGESKTVILFLASDPTDAARLRLGEEAREIQERLDRARLRERFELVTRWSVRAADVVQALLDVQPQVVHFSGHGGAADERGTATDQRGVTLLAPGGGPYPSPEGGGLYFEDEFGQAQFAPASVLAALFEQFTDHVQCVLLNACYSEGQARAIARHIPYVVGMHKAVSDRAAIAFSTGYYMALGAGRTVEQAYKLGCIQIGLQGIPEDLTPVLIERQGK